MTDSAGEALKRLAHEFEVSRAAALAAIAAADKEKIEIARLKAELERTKREHREELAAERAAFESDVAAWKAKVERYLSDFKEANA